MSAETGHAPGRSYVDQNGAPHTNGAQFFDNNERDIAPILAANNLVGAASASGVIAQKTGTLFITDASAAALTLAAPTSGTDDGSKLSIVSTTAAAHTVVTPANKLNGTHTTATFAAAIGNSVDLVAYQGVWYVWNSIGITVS